MADTTAVRRAKLANALALVQELIRVNESAARQETALLAMSISTTEIENTLNKVFDGCGPPTTGSAVALIECTGDTITDRLVNLLNSNITGGVSWAHDA